jgi:hypothetical protein
VPGSSQGTVCSLRGQHSRAGVAVLGTRCQAWVKPVGGSSCLEAYTAASALFLPLPLALWITESK